MKLSHYLAKALQALGVSHAFGVQGGAVVHLFDSLHTQSNITICYTHHEQSAALAAVSNSKYTHNLGVCITTTGPAASNALTGLLAAWQDSTPVLFISGQTRLTQTSYGLNVRQRGSQECNILDIVKPWTKYSALVQKPSDLPLILNKAYSKAMDGRPGPVWVDLPVDLQWSDVIIDLDICPHSFSKSCPDNIERLNDVLQIIYSAKRPIFVLGRMAYREKILVEFLSSIKDLNIPIATTWGAPSVSKGLSTSSGVIGVSGQPSANYSIRAADCVVFLGCHFSVTQSGANYKALSNNQTLVFINIDHNELEHILHSEGSLLINSDANHFIEFFLNNIGGCDLTLNSMQRRNWLLHIEEVTRALSPQSAALICNTESKLNPHRFLCALYEELTEYDLVVVDGGGCALYAGFQCIPSNSKFSVICSTSISAMGTGLPELCGAGITNNINSLNICIIGDGSLMFNIQELQTIKTNLEASIIIVINNSGYLAIRHTQKQFLDMRYFGTSSNGNGIEIPSIESIAKTFAFDYMILTSNDQIEESVEAIAATRCTQKHLIVELVVSPDHVNLFTASFMRATGQNSYTQHDLHLMEPFASFDYKYYETFLS
jgi:acetolactate synthase-1/2/3 large subunit